VNLELPTPAGAPLGGHIVQGHVDGTGTLLALDPINPGEPGTDWRLRLAIPNELTRYVVEKGSITIEGISLTVALIATNQVEVAIIPHTYAATSLRTLTAGAALNIEVDVLSKYAERQRSSEAGFTLTEQYLIANGY
jgi:riboflavin synthase